MIMEEEIQMLFRLAMPEDWRNRMPSTPPPHPSSTKMEDASFWTTVGLRSYAQLDFDLELSLDHHPHHHQGHHRPTKRRSSQQLKGKSLGGILYQAEGQNPSEKSMVHYGTVCCGGSAGGEGEECSDVIVPPNALTLINILRLTIDCPFRDVRKQAANVLLGLKEKGVPVPYALIYGPTTFIHPWECPSIDVERFASELGFAEHCDSSETDSVLLEDPTFADEEIDNDLAEKLAFQKARLLSEAFLSSGRVDHTIQLMAYHPDYLEIFLRTHHFLMRGDGPLPYNFRNYIAIMAAARYRCTYLMELQKREFLYQGGDPNWLRGLDFAPPKLVALYNINKVMAHRPWVLKKEDLQHLTKKAGWSLSELVQAMVLLAHFHSLSSFIHGCGITPEVDFDNGHTFLVDPQQPHHQMVAPVVVPTSSGSSSEEAKVSFAPSIVTTTNSLNPSSSPKQTKSILKKTEPSTAALSTSPASSTGSSSSGSGKVGSSNATSGGINVPTQQPQQSVHFHPYHSYEHRHSYSLTHYTGSFNGSPVLKGDALRNAKGQGKSPPKAGSTVSEVDIIMATMKNLSETSPIEDPEERKKRFETVARSDLDTQLGLDSSQKENAGVQGKQGQSAGLGAGASVHKSMLPPDVTPFIAEPEFTYEDFAKRGQLSELHTFRIQDYSWEEHGFSLVNRLYAEVGQILDDKFKVAQNMTYYTIGGRANVDTTKFRTAVWNYIQCLYGIRHDDYDYGEVNQLLERPLKAFIKTVCCYPERITKQDYDNVMREFKHSEKVHVNLMIMEAKLQAELLYALRTVMKLMF